MSLAHSFPHAYNYLKKHSYSPEELKALYRLTFLFSVDTVINLSAATGTRRGPAIVAGLGGPDVVNAKVYYWEVSIDYAESDTMELGQVNVGFESDEHRVLYRSDGNIIGLSVSDQVLYYDNHDGAESFGRGDIVGCGITEYGGDIFFTKNGRRIAAVKARRLHSKLCRPCLVTTEKSTAFSLNHGDAPFKFDIEAFCDSAIHASRLAEDLPPELFQMVVRQCFDDVSGIEDIKAIHRLSTVCRYCYKMCRNSARQTLSLTSHREMSAATCLGLLSRTLGLVTQEDTRIPWLHILFTRSYPGLAQNWTCDYNNCELRIPPRVPADLHTFVRSSHWSSLSRLEIRQRRFKNWNQFAKLVFSLPHLEHLTISDVGWGSSPKVPPSWLRFQGRLRSFHCSNITGPHLWLFIAGRRVTGNKLWGPALLADDIPVSVQIVEAVLNVCALPVHCLDCEHRADASYRLTGFDSTDRKVKAIELTLVPINEDCHRLSNIWIREASANLPPGIVSRFSALPGFGTLEIEIVALKEPSPPSGADYTLSSKHSKDWLSIRTDHNRPVTLGSILNSITRIFENFSRLYQERQASRMNVTVLAKALSDAEARVYIKPPPESWGKLAQKRKISQWDTQENHSRKPTQMKGNVKRR